jgi:hypothetical protein
MKNEAVIRVLISIYLFLLAVGIWFYSADFWQREKLILASIGTIFSLLMIVSIISYFTNKKSLLIINVISLITFTVYLIGGFIWYMLKDHTFVLFGSISMAIITPLNLCVIFYTKGKIEKFNQ